MKKTAITSLLFLTPAIAFAQSITLSPLVQFVHALSYLEATVVPVLIGAALIVFFWGLVKYLWRGEAKDKESGRSIMIWGLVALAVMVSVWGIIRLAQGAFGITGNETVNSPIIPGI